MFELMFSRGMRADAKQTGHIRCMDTDMTYTAEFLVCSY